MHTLRVLHATRCAVILGSGLLCLLGFVAGCDSDSSSSGPATPTAVDKAKQDEMAKAIKEARQKDAPPLGVPGRSGHAKPKS